MPSFRERLRALRSKQVQEETEQVTLGKRQLEQEQLAQSKQREERKQLLDSIRSQVLPVLQEVNTEYLNSRGSIHESQHEPFAGDSSNEAYLLWELNWDIGSDSEGRWGNALQLYVPLDKIVRISLPNSGPLEYRSKWFAEINLSDKDWRPKLEESIISYLESRTGSWFFKKGIYDDISPLT